MTISQFIEIDPRRCNGKPVVAGTRIPVTVVLDQLADAGSIQELLRRYPPDLKPLQSLGYRHLINFLQGRWSWEEAIELLKRDTRRYAKRQLTWFKADPEVRWFHPGQIDAMAAALEEFFGG